LRQRRLHTKTKKQCVEEALLLVQTRKDTEGNAATGQFKMRRKVNKEEFKNGKPPGEKRPTWEDSVDEGPAGVVLGVWEGRHSERDLGQRRQEKKFRLGLQTTAHDEKRNIMALLLIKTAGVKEKGALWGLGSGEKKNR